MNVGIVGSRTLGSCECERAPMEWMRSPEGVEHRQTCNLLREQGRMREIVVRLATANPDDLNIISGKAPGADTLAKQACDVLSVRCTEYPPAAGDEPFAIRAHARNQRIVDESDMLVAVFDRGPRSPGTSDTVRRALAKGIPVYVFHNGRWAQS